MNSLYWFTGVIFWWFIFYIIARHLLKSVVFAFYYLGFETLTALNSKERNWVNALFIPFQAFFYHLIFKSEFGKGAERVCYTNNSIAPYHRIVFKGYKIYKDY